MKRIGIFGGTFDPVHLGHLELSKKAVLDLGLDKLIIIPNGNPPHKEKEANKFHRLNMLKELFCGMENIEISDYEIKKNTYSYTYEALDYLKNVYEDAELFFIMGMDNLSNIGDWKCPDQIIKNATLVFFNRAGFEIDKGIAKKLEESYDAKILFLDFSFPISSTTIKKNIKKGEYILDVLPVCTFQYIIKNGLYGNPNISEYDYYEDEIKKYMEEKRYKHSIGVSLTAYLLAIKYNEDVKLAYLTGLLHDIAKRIPIDEQLELCKTIKIHPDEFVYPKMLHSPAGAALIESKYKITDKKLLNAVRYHTIGDKDMSLFDKIIYMADYIEPTRDFEGVKKLRELSFKDINKAIIKGIDTTIISLIEDELKVSPVLLTVRNDLIGREE